MVFDFDDTLIKSDKKYDAKSRFKKCKVTEKNPIMMKIFYSIKANPFFDWRILTARPPAASDDILSSLNLEDTRENRNRIYTRRHHLTDKEIDFAFNSEIGKREFHREMIRDKILRLNELSKLYDVVFMFDDKYNEFDRERLNNNVYVLCPIW